ncbi:hypothetical protein Tco_1518675 [Tanacetum coccineum]
MDTSKLVTIPMQPNVDLSKSQGPSTPAEVKRMKRIPYDSVVGSIMYAVRNTKDMFLVFGGNSTTKLSVTCYTDASWETDCDDLRSQTGFVFVMNRGAVDWKILSAITIADEPGVQKDNNLADPFTKPMPCTKHVEHARSIGLRPAGSFM